MCFTTKCYGTFVREVKIGNQNFFLCHHRDCERGLTLTGPKAFLFFVDCKLFYVFTGLTHFYQSWPNDFSNVFRIAWSLSNEIRGWNMLHNLIHVLDVSYFQKLSNSVKEDSNENDWSLPPSMSCFPMTRAVDPVAQLLFTFWWQENNKTIWY